MKRAAISSLAFMTTACSQVEAWRHPELAACDEFTKASLSAPSTYARKKATISDSRLPLGYWTEGTRETLSAGMADAMKDLDARRAREGGVRTVLIEYDASNGFGVPLRSLSMCRFEMSSTADSDFVRKPSADAAKLASAMAGVVPGAPEASGCCESKETLARLEKYQGAEKYLSQQVVQ